MSHRLVRKQNYFCSCKLNVNVDTILASLQRQLLHCSLTWTVPQTVPLKGNSGVGGSRSHIFTFMNQTKTWLAAHSHTSHFKTAQYAYSLLFSWKLPLDNLFHVTRKMLVNKSTMICCFKTDFKPSVILYKHNNKPQVRKSLKEWI